MYRHGFELPEFSLPPLSDNPKAMAALREVFTGQLDVAAEYGLSFLLTGLDYRTSPDWGRKLGYSPAGLAEATLACIDFLQDVAKPYEDQIPRLLIGGIFGPRGDAYSLNREITVESDEDCHVIQLSSLKKADVDFACAMTFNNVEEAIGASRAAARIGIPLSVAFTLDSSCRLKSEPSLAEAIIEIDAQTGEDRPEFYMINCSHPVEYKPSLEAGPWFMRLRGVRPNASKMEKLALCKLGHLEEDNPVELSGQLRSLADRYSRKVLAWRLSNSMDGKGAWRDNRMIERLWRSPKYECVFLNAFETGSEIRAGIGKWMSYHNFERPARRMAC